MFPYLYIYELRHFDNELRNVCTRVDAYGISTRVI